MKDRLLKAIEGIEKVVASDAEWRDKYTVVFRIKCCVIDILLKESGFEFTWVDPDMDYKDDVLAYETACLDLKRRLLLLP